MASGDPADIDRKPKPSGKKKKKLSQREQSERFIETARALEADESGEAFERALEHLVARRD
jgi:hypothetical protein